MARRTELERVIAALSDERTTLVHDPWSAEYTAELLRDAVSHLEEYRDRCDMLPALDMDIAAVGRLLGNAQRARKQALNRAYRAERRADRAERDAAYWQNEMERMGAL